MVGAGTAGKADCSKHSEHSCLCCIFRNLGYIGLGVYDTLLNKVTKHINKVYTILGERWFFQDPFLFKHFQFCNSKIFYVG